jgi:hypothetical protein
MNVEIGAEAALFSEKEYISGIFVAVYLSARKYVDWYWREGVAPPAPPLSYSWLMFKYVMTTSVQLSFLFLQFFDGVIFFNEKVLSSDCFTLFQLKIKNYLDTF